MATAGDTATLVSHSGALLRLGGGAGGTEKVTLTVQKCMPFVQTTECENEPCSLIIQKNAT